MAPLTLTDEAIERVEALAAADASAQILRDGLAALPEEQRDAVLARVLDEREYAVRRAARASAS
jgi:DNA-directed RNA polymerase specialized sigma24 family protein